VSIGRDEPESTCGIKIASEYVSRLHVRLQVVEDTVEMTVFSKHTTKIDGQDVQRREEPYPLHEGSVVKLSKGAIFVVELHHDNTEKNKPQPVPDEKKVGESPLSSDHDAPQPGKKTQGSATAPTVTETPNKKESLLKRLLKVFSTKGKKQEKNDEKPSSDATQQLDPTLPPTVMQTTPNGQANKNDNGKTQWVDPKTIEKLQKKDEQEASKRKIRLIVGLVAFFLALGVVYSLIYRQPAKELVWRKMVSTNEYAIAIAPLTLPGLDMSGDKQPFVLQYPRNGNGPIKTKQDYPDKGYTTISVDTFAGQKKEVLCHVTLEYGQNTRILHCNREQAFKDWQKGKQSIDSSWIFEETLPLECSFIENGFPYLSAFYTRRRNGKNVFGNVRFYRHADLQIVVFVDMPKEERWRGEMFLLANNFFSYNKTNEEDIISFLFSHWEGSNALCSGTLDELLQAAQELVDKKTFQNWERAEVFLQAALVLSYTPQAVQAHEKARELLIELRQQKKNTYDSYLVKIRQETKADIKEQIRRECMEIFNNPDDMRTYEIRLEAWGQD
jgi:hypothetical protein